MKLSTTTTTLRFLSGGRHLLRRISTVTPPTPSPPPPPTSRRINKWELYSKVSEVGLTGEKVTDVLHQLTKNVMKFSIGDLYFCIKKLRQYDRNHHCLEILEWMEKGEPHPENSALRLDLICKLEGVDEAEKFFDNIPPEMKKPSLYGTLLNCYCQKNRLDKALDLFEKMREMKSVFNYLAFSNLMGLYVKLDQPEKVLPLIEEMKLQNIPLNNVIYQIWIQSLGRLKDLEGVARVIDEVEGQSCSEGDWRLYSVIASVYINAGQPQRAAQAMKKMEEVLDRVKESDRFAYHHKISLYASIGDLESVLRAWSKLNSIFKTCHNQSYGVMLRALSKLDDIGGLKKCYTEWESRYKSFDVRLTNTVIDAFLRHDMLKEAELVFTDAVDRSGQKLWRPHLSFMGYYLGKRQTNCAQKHMEAAISKGWKPQAEKFYPFLKQFKEEKNVDAAEELCSMLKKAELLDSRDYLCLLGTYAAADKVRPDLRQRMMDDHVSISIEHEELLSLVCPS